MIDRATHADPEPTPAPDRRTHVEIRIRGARWVATLEPTAGAPGMVPLALVMGDPESPDRAGQVVLHPQRKRRTARRVNCIGEPINRGGRPVNRHDEPRLRAAIEDAFVRWQNFGRRRKGAACKYACRDAGLRMGPRMLALHLEEKHPTTRGKRRACKITRNPLADKTRRVFASVYRPFRDSLSITTHDPAQRRPK